mmetsp:Transcript_30196/g.22439  ORF Transcript_30196/g.22439 Transcript_30196/m.22439 type:complete len:99 (+) Transcript_30196:517-813(+)|eukprot:CAMPEP_0202980490 /NCGR_PEP_ID=MMETSP1396-20130829/86410_1 /ASSEMBLY_ACC=CAM_ASM_000872 /TAXON_ID= /ORGANISM="Pseudokeronopsis sp., Strain Brazil" /LENGTH=98 /DNA_ID=CAMNT_0049720509 /DNA_START=1489 /DNA_END=1785 /DNA_ORIENTATION=-
MPDNVREEEKFLYKYFKERTEKKIKKVADEDEFDEEGDAEIEAFANDVIEKEMKRLAGGESDIDEDLDEGEEGESEVGSEAEEENEDFFEGEDDLEDV